jgi:iron transport multicopper oxidase
MSSFTTRLTCYLICLLPIGFLAQAATVTYDFNVGWVRANPDGQAERPVIGINGQWPIPMMNITKGDRVIVNVKNDLGNQSTSLHWHGIYHNGTTHMDGAVGVSQCSIMPGASFTYNFTVSWLFYGGIKLAADMGWVAD